MDKKEFNRIKNELLEGYNFEQAVEVVRLLKKNIKGYCCPEDLSVEDFKKTANSLLVNLYDSEWFGKKDCASSSGRFEAYYLHNEGGAYEIGINLMPLDCSYGVASDGSKGFNFE